MRVLLHTCCAPCLCGSRIPLERDGHEVTSYWYNPNIHPFTEHRKRLHTFQRYIFLEPVDHIVEEGYDHLRFIRGQIGSFDRYYDGDKGQLMTEEQKNARCEFCYRDRIFKTAEKALAMNYDAFLTTMLISGHQNHESIRNICESASKKTGIEFLYYDLRKYWKASIKRSKQLEMYRQAYCGCVFSEHERYMD